MRYTLRKDKKKRFIFNQTESTTVLARVLKADQSLRPLYRFKIINKLSLRPKNCFFGRTKNHCILTSRSAGVLKTFGLSRIRFRELANRGYLTGIKRSSW